MGKYICIHGHFYQPPRENAWLEEVELQESAHPFHDWNERITSECYGPNTASRILNEEGTIIDITNNYSKISFNYGPTLLSWLETKDPVTYQSILEADKLSMERFSGHGSAMAQVYNHIIMPLANRKDKETQVIWGIRDFEHRFKRHPEGMWLAETAVDIETLEVLVVNGIKFTVLAPHQAGAFKRPGDMEMTYTSQKPVNTRMPYRCKLPSGREIIIYFYDGEKSRSVAFNHLLNDGKEFANQLLSGFDDDDDGDQLVHIATDGESYGHHHRYGDMALAFGINYIENNSDAILTNYGEYIEKCGEIGECEIVENSSWSCMHGIERWRSDCGCSSGGLPGWNQQWREPLREALDWLRDEVNKSFETQAREVLKNPWEARNKYIDVILERSTSKKVHDYLNTHPDKQLEINKGVRWLELQRHALLMYTSCGWFFEEVSRIETIQILQYACRVIQLYYQLTGTDLEVDFLQKLKSVKSNIPELRNAEHVYYKFVEPTRLDLQRVGMHYAVSTLFEPDVESIQIFNYTAINKFFDKKEGGVQQLVMGVTQVRSDVTYVEMEFSFVALYLGQHNIIGYISLDMEGDYFDEMCAEVSMAFDESRVADVIGLMQKYFGQEKFTLWHLFKDQKRKVISQILAENLEQVEDSYRNIYKRDYPLLNMMLTSEIPIPNAYTTTLEYVLNTDLRNSFNKEKIELSELARIFDEFEKWDLRIDDSLALQKHAGERVERTMMSIFKNIYDVSRLHQLNVFFSYLEKFGLTPNLSRSQNLYFYMAKSIYGHPESKNEEWDMEFKKLGKNLGVKVNY